MMGKKTLTEIKTEVAALLAGLPGPSPEAWMKSEIEKAKRDPNRDSRTLEMLCAALDQASKKRRKPKARRVIARR